MIICLAPFGIWRIASLAGQLVGSVIRPGTSHSGLTAGEIISTPRRLARKLQRALLGSAGLLLLVIAWVGAIAVWVLAIPYWVALEVLSGLRVLRPMQDFVAAFRSGGKKQAKSGPGILFRVGHRLLSRYDLATSLGHTYTLRQSLVQLFDREFDGGLHFDRVVDQALRKKDGATARANVRKKVFGDYSDPTRRDCRIHVAAMATDLATGTAVALPGDTPVVDGLLAATAATPFVEPVTLPRESRAGVTYVDASVVANEPIAALVEHLRAHVNPLSTGIYIYPITPFPTGSPDGAATLSPSQRNRRDGGTRRDAASDADGDTRATVDGSLFEAAAGRARRDDRGRAHVRQGLDLRDRDRRARSDQPATRIGQDAGGNGQHRVRRDRRRMPGHARSARTVRGTLDHPHPTMLCRAALQSWAGSAWAPF